MSSTSRENAITRVKFNRFTAFEKLTLDFVPGINILIGTNGTGKTHILKTLYAACDITQTGVSFVDKLLRVFLPYQNQLGRLVHRSVGRRRGFVTVWRGEKETKEIEVSFSDLQATVRTRGEQEWRKQRIKCAYIPVKEMLAHAPGFRSLYSGKEIHFEETYPDIIDRAFLPVSRGPASEKRGKFMQILEECMTGKTVVANEEFFLKNRQGNLEFSLLAEGMRKLALLAILIRNETLLEGSVLFWDEPEANLNPKMMKTVVDILLELQRMGVQVFLATHDYVVLKEFDLQSKEDDSLRFHSLFRSEEGGPILSSSSDKYAGIHNNAIAETFSDLYDRDIQRALGKGAR